MSVGMRKGNSERRWTAHESPQFLPRKEEEVTGLDYGIVAWLIFCTAIFIAWLYAISRRR
jgi:hypothetical protein